MHNNQTAIPRMEVKDLKKHYPIRGGRLLKALDGVSLKINTGDIFGIVGESGCGKSVTHVSIMQLVQTPPGRILGGEVIFDGKDLLKLGKKDMQKIRGSQISMIFQEPMTSLNPVFKVGTQISEVIRTHQKVSMSEAWEIGTKALEEVGISDPKARMNSYPFEMSGGMRKRVMIAIAVACKSKLIIADEPTTALDVTTQAQVMELLLDLVKKHGTSLIVITHNLGLVTRYADRIYVMYTGRVIEEGTTEKLLTEPKHPYTKGLLNSVPKMDSEQDVSLIPIEGTPPNLARLPKGCSFAPRCPFSSEFNCAEKDYPNQILIEGIHYASCHMCKENKG